MKIQLSVLILCTSTLIACGGSNSSGSGGNQGGSNPPPTETPVTRYDMANGCYAIQSTQTKNYVTAAENTYNSNAESVGAGDAFFMQPA
ncbi:MAG: peptidase M19, partial [Gammaproteobacteria bacterium]|nr:peptidase M19 [Gammaproteobacteria bacterium]MBU1833053.1 peptidase M19 [Gammaproteobacteria bacterium]